jgi:thiamine pyrophosphate-dependent acetolactate synthase large subunit-like protein
MLMGELATLVIYRLPVKVIILKHSVRGMTTREQIAFVGNPQYRVQLQPIGFEAFAKACEMADYAANNPPLVERILLGGFNHPGTVVVQAVVDPARIIHDGSLRNLAVAKRVVPDERPAPVHVYREGVYIGFTGATCRIIPPHTVGFSLR